MKEVEGVIPVALTFYKSDLSLDEENIRRHIDFLIEKGVHGVWAVGSVSEFPLLSKEERKKVVEIIVDQVNQRVPVYVCTAHTRTDEVIELAKHAKDVGADAVSTTPPYYYIRAMSKPDVLYEFYKSVAKAVDIPLIIYNFPAGLSVDIPPTVIAKLANDFANVVGVKDTTESLVHMIEILRLTKGKFYVLAGSEDFLLPLMLAGGHGAVSGLANVFPELPVELYNSFKKGNYKRAEEIHKKILAVRAIAQIGSTPISFLKEALKLRGFPINAHVRSPLLPLSSEQREQLKRIILDVLGQEFIKP
jgi:4-hydroxy-tetrahydrodipicolinate synthase